MGGFLILLGLVLLAASVFVVIKPRPKLGMKSRWFALPLLLGSIVSCSIGLPPVEDAPAAKVVAGPPSIKAADKSIESVEVSGPNLHINVYLAKPKSDVLDIGEAGMIAEKVGRALKSGAKEDGEAIEFVQLHYELAGMDRLGNDKRIDYVNIALPAADLRAANYDNLSFFGVMDLAHEVSWGSRLGGEALSAWCAEKAKFTRLFCLKALT